MRSLTRRKIGKLPSLGISLALLVLLGDAWFCYHNALAYRSSGARVTQTQDTMLQLEGLLSRSAEATSAERAYLLSKDDWFLNRIAVLKKDAFDRCDRLRATAGAGGEANSANLLKVTQQVHDMFDGLDRSIEMVDQKAPATQDVIQTRALMLELRGAVDVARNGESTTLTQRMSESTDQFNKAIFTYVTSSAVAIAMVVLAFYLLRRDENNRRKNAEAEADILNYNKLLIESTGDGIYGLDVHGLCTFLNAAGSKMLGLTSDEAMGKSMHALTHHSHSDGTPYPPEQCPIYNVFKTKMASRVDNEVFFRKDGTSFPVEYSASAIYGGKKVTGAVVTFVDISARKQQEELIRESGERFRTLADNMAQLAWMADSNGAIGWYNQRWYDYTGTTPEEMRGWGWKTVHHPDYVEGVITKFQESIKNGTEWEDVFPLRGKDGTYRWFLSRALPIRNEQGKIIRWFGTNTDVTEQREVEDALRHSEEHLTKANEEAEQARAAAEAANVSKSQFLANMSHELRTPLNAVIMYSELLQEEAEDRQLDGFIPDLDRIRGAGKHLLALVNGVLDLSKIEAGKMELYLETFEVCAMVQDVVITIQPLVMKKQNTLDLQCPDDAGGMYADVTKVRQILFNLLSNACKFTENGTVTLHVARVKSGQDGSTDMVTFEVKDSGIGMTPAQIDKLFQPFTQADASTTRKYGGTGLGLAISKRFCEMMGGSLTVSSEEHMGSTFTLTLPARVAKPKIEESKTTTSDPTVHVAGKVRVLVIDDDPAVRDLMSKSLSTAGHIEYFTAADGEEGLRLARQTKPDVIFLDVLMPAMDGWAVLSAIKADERLVDIPVIMLTMHSDKEMGYMLGASEYLTKPIDRDRLTAVLKRYTPTDAARGVLVVEDDEPSRQVLSRTLAKRGWEVTEASNGRIALDRVRESIPNLILLDLMMPEMDGFEFLAELRHEVKWQDIPVVVLTSKDLTPEERALLSGKVERILQKGEYTRHALLREVRKIVEDCTAKAAASGDPSAAAACVRANVESDVEVPTASGT